MNNEEFELRGFKDWDSIDNKFFKIFDEGGYIKLVLITENNYEKLRKIYFDLFRINLDDDQTIITIFGAIPIKIIKKKKSKLNERGCEK